MAYAHRFTIGALCIDKNKYKKKTIAGQRQNPSIELLACSGSLQAKPAHRAKARGKRKLPPPARQAAARRQKMKDG